ncbi:MAG: heavy metal translocating P-type ATPase [Verrucomicrobia bacterium]|nr:MAG: heavy metal translocating P-type ATPase [Verrucomicrobiota bacterium]
MCRPVKAARSEAESPAAIPPRTAPAPRERCFHCATPCPPDAPEQDGRRFCCRGCLAVYQVLTNNGLGHFYDLGQGAGVRVKEEPASGGRWDYLDDPGVRDRLLDFREGNLARVTLHVPAMHCVACVWLLENLFRLREGIGSSEVNFPRREVSILFDLAKVPLSGVVALLDSLGYPPVLRLDAVEGRRARPSFKRLYLQLGVAGFAFGNTMLFSFPAYLGLEPTAAAGLSRFFGWLSMALAVPVVLFSAADYWKAAWQAVRRRVLTIDFPIALGLAALFGRSAWEVMAGAGPGYFDSLTGLVFFLLCGRLFQQKSYERLSFDRDYRAFFPMAVTRRRGDGEETVPVSRVKVGDRLIIRHRELLPADARLVRGRGLLDYSFVTGESAPVEKRAGDLLYAGGRQMGTAVEVEVLRPVAQSYLASLWSREEVARPRSGGWAGITDRVSRWFTVTVVGVALAAAAWWAGRGQWGVGLWAFTAVLIVACPCALALAAPFAHGAAQRRLGLAGVFLRSADVVEALARVDMVVFDKTGTLTAPGQEETVWEGDELTVAERRAVAALAGQSAHPLARAMVRAVGRIERRIEVAAFHEEPGFGLSGEVDGHRWCLGSAAWLRRNGVPAPVGGVADQAEVWCAVNGRLLGRWRFRGRLRPESAPVLRAWRQAGMRLALLSGDQARERDRFAPLFGPDAEMLFEQTPAAKLEQVRRWREEGRVVMMVGDGLNDAGALRASDVGVAVTAGPGEFSPASDVILEGGRLDRLPAAWRLARSTTRLVRASIGVSLVYNAVGISLAAQGLLAPWICAVLMPLSSVSVIALAVGGVRWAAARLGLPTAHAISPETSTLEAVAV